MDQKKPPFNTLKQAVISILIGATISFLTVLFQGALDLFKGYNLEDGGAIVGMLKYIHSWSSHLKG